MKYAIGAGLSGYIAVLTAIFGGELAVLIMSIMVSAGVVGMSLGMLLDWLTAKGYVQ